MGGEIVSADGPPNQAPQTYKFLSSAYSRLIGCPKFKPYLQAHLVDNLERKQILCAFVFFKACAAYF